MDVELLPAVVAGLVGGVAMLVLGTWSRDAARSFDILEMWARFLGLDGARVVGLVLHLGVSVAVAVLYVLGFRIAGAVDSGWAWGLIGSVIHWLVGGVFVGGVPGGEEVSAPGPFGMRLGPRVAVGFLTTHLAYGLLVGLVYFSLHSAGGLGNAI